MEAPASTTSAALPLLKPRYPGELFLSMRRDMLGVFARLAALGDAAAMQLGPRRLVLLSHPDLARALLIDRADAVIKGRALRLTKFLLGEGLLTSEGAFHRQQRKLVLPAFHHTRLKAYAETMGRRADQMAQAWSAGRAVDVHAAAMRLTLEIVAETLFAADVQGEADRIGRALTASLAMFERTSNPLAEWLNRLPVPGTLRLRRARTELDATIYRLIDEHRAAGDQGDLLSMLLAAQDEEGCGMTDEQVRDEAMTLFLAGHETTAVALTWTWHLLARHPHVERRLYEEATGVLAGRPATLADLPQLPYTRQVFSEAMRLYPPAWAFSREVVPETLALGPYTFRQGDTLLVSPYRLHRDARFWSDPGRFDPDRFAPERRRRHTRFAFLPFSTGVRGCIGEQFAWAEGLIVLATIAQRWRLAPVSERHVGLAPSITLRPAGPVRLLPVPR